MHAVAFVSLWAIEQRRTISTAMGSMLASAPGMYPRPRFPAPPDPRRTREYIYFGPCVAGGGFARGQDPPGAGPGPGALRLSLEHTAVRKTPSHGMPVPGPLSIFRQIGSLARP